MQKDIRVSERVEACFFHHFVLLLLFRALHLDERVCVCGVWWGVGVITRCRTCDWRQHGTPAKGGASGEKKRHQKKRKEPPKKKWKTKKHQKINCIRGCSPYKLFFTQEAWRRLRRGKFGGGVECMLKRTFSRSSLEETFGWKTFALKKFVTLLLASRSFENFKVTFL